MVDQVDDFLQEVSKSPDPRSDVNSTQPALAWHRTNDKLTSTRDKMLALCIAVVGSGMMKLQNVVPKGTVRAF